VSEEREAVELVLIPLAPLSAAPQELPTLVAVAEELLILGLTQAREEQAAQGSSLFVTSNL